MHAHLLRSFALVAFALLALVTAGAHAQSPPDFRLISVDTPNAGAVVAEFPSTAVDGASGLSYTVVQNGSTLVLFRCSLAGAGCLNRTLVISPASALSYPKVALDTSAAKLLVLCGHDVPDPDGSERYTALALLRCELDGTACTVLYFATASSNETTAHTTAKSLAVDLARGWLYAAFAFNTGMGSGPGSIVPRVFRCATNGSSCERFEHSGTYSVNYEADFAAVVNAQTGELLVVGRDWSAWPFLMRVAMGPGGSGEAVFTFVYLSTCTLPNLSRCGFTPSPVLDLSAGKLLVVTSVSDAEPAKTLALFRCTVNGTECAYTNLSAVAGVGAGLGNQPVALVDTSAARLLVVALTPRSMSLFRCLLDGSACTSESLSSEYTKTLVAASAGAGLVATVQIGARLLVTACDTSAGSSVCTEVGEIRPTGEQSGYTPSIAQVPHSAGFYVATMTGDGLNTPTLFVCSEAGVCTVTQVADGTGQGVGSGLHPSVVVDVAGAKVLVVTQNAANGDRPSLFRCELDGTGCMHTDLSAGLGLPNGCGATPVALVDSVSSSPALLVASFDDASDRLLLFRCALDGSACTDRFVATVTGAPSMVIDAQSLQLVIVTSSGWVFRCTLVGLVCNATSLEPMFTERVFSMDNPHVLIDEANNKLLIVAQSGDEGGELSRPLLLRCELDVSSCTFHDLSSGLGLSDECGLRPAALIDAASATLLVATDYDDGNDDGLFEPGRGLLFRCALNGTQCVVTELTLGQPAGNGYSPALLALNSSRVVVASNSQLDGLNRLALVTFSPSECFDPFVARFAARPLLTVGTTATISLVANAFLCRPMSLALVCPGVAVQFALTGTASSSSAFLSWTVQVGLQTASGCWLASDGVELPWVNRELEFTAGLVASAVRTQLVGVPVIGALVRLTLQAADQYGNLRLESGDVVTGLTVQFPNNITVAPAITNEGGGNYSFAFTTPNFASVTVDALVNGLSIGPRVVVVRRAPCSPGQKLSSDLTQCEACPANAFSSATEAVNCTACPANTKTTVALVSQDVGASSVANCSCVPGTYRLTAPEAGLACTVCPVRATCAGGQAVPQAQPGFLALPGRPDALAECPRPASCPGGTGCATGYTGLLCKDCAAGFYVSETGECHRCPAARGGALGAYFLLLGVVAAGTFALAVVTLTSGQGTTQTASQLLRKRGLPPTIGLSVAVFQVMGVLGRASLGWSRSSQRALAGFSLFSLDLSLFASTCAGTAAASYAWSMIGPVIVVALISTFWAVRRAINRWHQIGFGQMMLAVLSLAGPLAYLPLARATLALFACTRLPDGRYYLTTNMSFECYRTSEWQTLMVIFGLFGVCVYVIGIPLILAWLLRDKPQALFTNVDTVRALGGVYKLFRTRMVFVPIALMGKKLAIALISLVLVRVPIVQGLLFLLVVLVGGSVQTRLAPFYFPLYNRFDSMLGVGLSVVLVSTIPQTSGGALSSGVSAFLAFVFWAGFVGLLVVVVVGVVADVREIVIDRRAVNKGEAMPVRLDAFVGSVLAAQTDDLDSDRSLVIAALSNASETKSPLPHDGIELGVVAHGVALGEASTPPAAPSEASQPQALQAPEAPQAQESSDSSSSYST